MDTKTTLAILFSGIMLLFSIKPILGCTRANILPSIASYNGKNIPIVRIVNDTDYSLEVIITDPMLYKGGIVPAGKSALVSIPGNTRVPAIVTVKAIATKNGHLEGDWQESFPVPKSSSDFTPTRILEPASFK